MAIKTSAVMDILSSDGKSRTSRSITDINPDAAKWRITAFARGLVSLTNGTLMGVELVNREDITNKVQPTEPTITLNPNTATAESINDQMTVDVVVTYPGEKRAISLVGGQKPINSTITIDSDQKTIQFQGAAEQYYEFGEESAVITFKLAEGEAYTEKTFTFTFTNLTAGEIENI